MPSQKKKSYYFEQTDFTARIARVAANGEGVVIEEVRELAPGTPEEVKAFVQEFSRGKSGQFVRAACAVYPQRRLLRNCSLKDAAKPADPQTLEDVVVKQFKVDPAEYALAALNSDDGSNYDGSRPNREVVVCGAPRSEFKKAQDQLIECGVFPLRLEIGSVATAGLFLKALEAEADPKPLLVLEMDRDAARMLIFHRGRLDSARPLSLGLNSMIAGVREELGLKDEGAARRLFFSDSFDFREMGARLIDRLLRELQSMIGFYEVQTGQSLSRMICTLLPPKLSWLNQTFASALGMEVYALDVAGILAKSNLRSANESLEAAALPYGLLGLMIDQTKL